MLCGRIRAGAVRCLPVKLSYYLYEGSSSSVSNLHSTLAYFYSSYEQDITKSALSLQRVLIVYKFSRFERERARHPYFTEKELICNLKAKGSIFTGLKERYEIHQRHLDELVCILKRRGSELKAISVVEYNSSHLDDADTIISAGGDGTFLEVSSKVKGGSRIPIIGINTDPERSAGHLCLRFASCDGKPRGLEEVVQRLLIGQFKWLKRNRIQITVVYSDIDKRILPDLALNDVLFVENNPSKTCYYEIEVCGLRDRSGRQIINIKEKQKSSGFLVSTGTGSSAWLFNTKKLWKDDVSELIKIVERRANVDLSHLSVGDITDEYNESIVYPPDDPRMKFGVRELINSGIFRGHVHKGYAHKIIIKSRSEARLVIDGARSHQLHPGTSAIFEIVPSQAVHTVSF